MFRHAAICLLILSPVSLFTTQAAPPAVPTSHLAVDVVALKSGKSLRGAVVESRPDGTLLVAVSSDWLKSHDPKWWEQVSKDNTDRETQAWDQLQERLIAWKDAAQAEPRLHFFLTQQQQELDARRKAEDPAPAEFLWIEVPRADLSRTVIAAPERRRVAALAWYAGIANVEQRGFQTLKRDLTTLDFPADAAAPDLSVRLPAWEQSAEEWAARQALVEFSLTEPLEFQGMGTTLTRTGEGAQIDWNTLLTGLLEDQTQSLLNELAGPGSPLAPPQTEQNSSAVREATRLKRRGFRVTRMATLREGEVQVESEFFARVSEPTRWVSVWKGQRVANDLEPRVELEAKIAADPQVQQILQVLQAVGGNSDSVITRAIRHGAAVMDAQAEVDGEFLAFRDRYLQRLDRPRLFVMP